MNPPGFQSRAPRPPRNSGRLRLLVCFVTEPASPHRRFSTSTVEQIDACPCIRIRLLGNDVLPPVLIPTVPVPKVRQLPPSQFVGHV